MGSTAGYAVQSITSADRKAAEKMRDELEIARTFRQTREKIWRQSERQYAGKMWRSADDDPTADLINVNVSFSTINTILPHLTGMSPEFMVEPFSGNATVKNARLQQAFLNRMWRKQSVGAQMALKAATWDYLVYGDGYLKTTWKIADRLVNIDETAEVVEMFVDRLSPWDVWTDPNATSLSSARWCAVRVWTTETEAREDDTLRIPAKFGFTTIDPTKDDDQGISDGDRTYHATASANKWVVLYEFYDLIEKKLYVVPEEGDALPWKIVEGIELPISQIPNYTIPQSPYHMGDLEQIYSIQREIDKTRSQAITHRKRNVSKVFVRKDALSPEAENALTSSIVGEMVPIEGDVPLGDLVQAMQLAPLPAESYSLATQAQQDIYEITGVSDYQRGSAPQITRTATEAQIMQGSSNVKIDAKLNDVEEALRQVGQLILGIAEDVFPMTDVDEMSMFIGGIDAQQINQLQAGDEAQAALESGDADTARAIADTAGLYGEATLTPTDEIFEGEYEVTVAHTSTDATSPQAKQAKFESVVSMLAELYPLLRQTGVNVDMGRVVRLWLEATGIPGAEAILSGAPGQPSPEEMQAQASAQGAPGGGNGAVPPELMAMLGGAQGGAPGPPAAPIGPDNSGSLDPASYPIVGM